MSLPLLGPADATGDCNYLPGAMRGPGIPVMQQVCLIPNRASMSWVALQGYRLQGCRAHNVMLVWWCRFGQLLGFAHAGMTAEGDNRVLMQKVAKELMSSAASPVVRARMEVSSLLMAPNVFLCLPERVNDQGSS